MTDIEQRIIDLIENNQYLSNEMKKKYILALFLMEGDKQREYLKLIQALDHKCSEVSNDQFVIHANETSYIQKNFDEVKRGILKKIQEDRKKSNENNQK